VSNQNQNLQFKITIDGKEATGELSVIVGAAKGASEKLVSGFENARDVLQGLEYGLKAFKDTFGKTFEAFREQENSVRKLNAASKITGTSLEELNKISGETKTVFKLSQNQANEFTIVLSKLTGKAGDLGKTQSAIAALLDLGAGQGLSAEQSLTAINQALLGIDEGTDKLFQKNPSVIYAAYAKIIGTTAGMLTDQQKAQALLNEVFEVGNKLTGQYSKYLESAGGSVDQLKTKTEQISAAIGEFIAGAITPGLIGLNKIIAIFQELPTWVQGLTGTLVLLTGTLIALQVTGLTGAIKAGNLFILNLFGVEAAAGAASIGVKGFFVSLGPIGWAIIGVTALVTAWGLLSSEIEKSDNKGSDFINRLQGLQAQVNTGGKIKNGGLSPLMSAHDISGLQTEEKKKATIVSYLEALKIQSDLTMRLNLAIIAQNDAKIKSLTEEKNKIDAVVSAYKELEKSAPEKPEIPVQDYPSNDIPVGDSPTSISGSFSDYKIEQARIESEAQIRYAQMTTDEKIRLTEQEIKASEDGSDRQRDLTNSLTQLYITKKMEEFRTQKALFASLVDSLKQSSSVMTDFLVDGFTRGFKNIENGFGKLTDRLSQIFFTQFINRMIGRGIDLLLTALGVPVPIGSAVTAFATGGVVRAGNPVVGVVGEGRYDEFVTTKPDMITVLKNEVVPELLKSPQFKVSPAIQNQFTPDDFKAAVESANLVSKTTRRNQYESNAESDRFKTYKMSR